MLARFVPVVRTFAPIVAGVGKMHYRTFVTYNIIGGLLWGVGVTTLGYFLGNIEFIKNNLEVAAIIIVAISITPMVFEYLRHRAPPRHRRGRGIDRPRLAGRDCAAAWRDSRSTPSCTTSPVSVRTRATSASALTKSMRRSTAPTSSGRRSA